MWMLESEAGVQKLLRDRIAECLRRHPKLRQADIARACNVKTPSVVGWLNGDTKTLKADTARLAADLFGCDQNWLATGVGSPGWADTGCEGKAALDVFERRRLRLLDVCEGKFGGSQAALSKACGRSIAQIGQILRPPRETRGEGHVRHFRIGEKLAREIEDRLNLGIGWLDGGMQETSVSGLTPAEELFLLAVRDVVRRRAVPGHMAATVLQVLENAPAKPDGQ